MQRIGFIGFSNFKDDYLKTIYAKMQGIKTKMSNASTSAMGSTSMAPSSPAVVANKVMKPSPILFSSTPQLMATAPVMPAPSQPSSSVPQRLFLTEMEKLDVRRKLEPLKQFIPQMESLIALYKQQNQQAEAIAKFTSLKGILSKQLEGFQSGIYFLNTLTAENLANQIKKFLVVLSNHAKQFQASKPEVAVTAPPSAAPSVKSTSSSKPIKSKERISKPKLKTKAINIDYTTSVNHDDSKLMEDLSGRIPVPQFIKGNSYIINQSDAYKYLKNQNTYLRNSGVKENQPCNHLHSLLDGSGFLLQSQDSSVHT